MASSWSSSTLSSYSSRDPKLIQNLSVPFSGSISGLLPGYQESLIRTKLKRAFDATIEANKEAVGIVMQLLLSGQTVPVEYLKRARGILGECWQSEKDSPEIQNAIVQEDVLLLSAMETGRLPIKEHNNSDEKKTGNILTDFIFGVSPTKQ